VTERQLNETGSTEVNDEWDIFRARQCKHCLGAHARACPRVRRLEWHPNGQLAAVEFWQAGQWPEDIVLWPEDIDVPAPASEIGSS
jgi:hypothetical protein